MFDIGSGEDKLDTLHAARGREIANIEISMRMRAPQHIADQRAIGLHISKILTIAGNEFLVFDALERLSDTELLESHENARSLHA